METSKLTSNVLSGTKIYQLKSNQKWNEKQKDKPRKRSNKTQNPTTVEKGKSVFVYV